MSLGYDGKLYILAFDHRGSFQKKMFGIEGDPTPEQVETISDATRLIFEGMLEGGVPILVDGHCVGAVGVSGVKSNEDAQIARAGIAALNASKPT